MKLTLIMLIKLDVSNCESSSRQPDNIIFLLSGTMQVFIITGSNSGEFL